MTDSPENPRAGERIAKLLARAGVASRREIERMIAEGRVKVDGALVETPATLLLSLRGVTVDDQPVHAPEAARLFMFHKPSGLITAERDPAGRPTIYAALRNALPPGAPRVMPIGRLDLNTEGLLLLTNDGALKRALELPATGIPRTYRARTFGDISQGQLEDLIDGVEIDGIRYGKIDANMERRTGRNQWIEMTLTEGKNREVRRVLEYLGLQVSRLLRVAYGPFHLGELQRGMAEEVPGNKVDGLLRDLGVAAPSEVAPRRRAPVVVATAVAPRAPERGAHARPAARPAPRPARPDPRAPRPDPRADAAPAARPAPRPAPRDELRNPGPAKPGQRRPERRDDRPERASGGQDKRMRDDGKIYGRTERAAAARGPDAAPQGRRGPGRSGGPGRPADPGKPAGNPKPRGPRK